MRNDKAIPIKNIGTAIKRKKLNSEVSRFYHGRDILN
jgi:hypothetical protein